MFKYVKYATMAMPSQSTYMYMYNDIDDFHTLHAYWNMVFTNVCLYHEEKYLASYLFNISYHMIVKTTVVWKNEHIFSPN